MKTVVITGSARGFGYAMLELFYDKGFNVVVCDINEVAVNDAVLKLKKKNKSGKVLSFVADVTDEKSIMNVISDTLKETSTIDIWINNAGG